jgi:hypothetical protein
MHNLAIFSSLRWNSVMAGRRVAAGCLTRVPVNACAAEFPFVN